jgi:hypothetical protein
MLWARKKEPAVGAMPAGTLVGLDLNASRARAVHGPAHTAPVTLPLDGAYAQVPLALSLQHRHPEIGRAGQALCRQSPHLVCTGFLPWLGEAREWIAGKHRLDAAKALGLVFERFRQACADTSIVVTVPAYFSRLQMQLVTSIAEKQGLHVRGSAKSPLVLATAGFVLEPWLGFGLVLDIDDYALTATTVVADGHQVTIHESRPFPHLGQGAWKERFLDRFADRCIRQSRRDPRDSPAAEQTIYDQIEDAFADSTAGKSVEFLIQTPDWYQSVVLRPEDMETCCGRLVAQTIQQVKPFLAGANPREAPGVVLVSSSVAILPGLLSSIETNLAPVTAPVMTESSDDFGDALLAQPVATRAGGLVRLTADTAAKSAHELAGRIARGELPGGILEHSLALSSDAVSRLAGPDRNTKKNFRLLSDES